MYSKEAQLDKNKKPNPKKLPKTEYRKRIDFIREKCGGICQMPDCNNPAQDFAHDKRAYKRDDTLGGLICRSCHTICDNPNPKQIEESKVKNIALKRIAKENKRDYEL